MTISHQTFAAGPALAIAAMLTATAVPAIGQPSMRSTESMPSMRNSQPTATDRSFVTDTLQGTRAQLALAQLARHRASNAATVRAASAIAGEWTSLRARLTGLAVADAAPVRGALSTMQSTYHRSERVRTGRQGWMRPFALLLSAALFFALAGGAARADQESQIGANVYGRLRGRGEIVDASPWYVVLNQIAERVGKVGDPLYGRRFRFILVRENQPNAFAVPGGNVYVTLPLMSFVKYKEELAGVLCHEMAHDIHHDVLNLARKRQNTGLIAGALDLILGGGAPVGTILQTAAQLQNLSFSRNVEEAADRTGARLCARAHENPWGMVWLFEQYSKAGAGGAMEILSDHPTDQHRISALKAEFRAAPVLFGRYSAHRSSGHHIPSLTYLRNHYASARAR